MAYTFKELKKKTVAELRGIAKDIPHEAVQGYSQLNKEHLLTALCTALGIDASAHAVHVGKEKIRLKEHIRTWSKRRDEALAAKDSDKLRYARRTIHRLKRAIAKI